MLLDELLPYVEFFDACSMSEQAFLLTRAIEALEEAKDILWNDS